MPFGHAPVSSRARRLRRIIFQLLFSCEKGRALSRRLPAARRRGSALAEGGGLDPQSPLEDRTVFETGSAPGRFTIPCRWRRAEVSNLNGRPSIRFQGGAGPWPVYSPSSRKREKSNLTPVKVRTAFQAGPAPRRFRSQAILLWSGRLDSNQRSRDPQSRAFARLSYAPICPFKVRARPRLSSSGRAELMPLPRPSSTRTTRAGSSSCRRGQA
jgi:hypothetical protein